MSRAEHALPLSGHGHTGKESQVLCVLPLVSHCPLCGPSLSLSLSHAPSLLDVIEWVKAAALRRGPSHVQPSIQGILGGCVQRIVFRQRQHHCISLEEANDKERNLDRLKELCGTVTSSTAKPRLQTDRHVQTELIKQRGPAFREILK